MEYEYDFLPDGQTVRVNVDGAEHFVDIHSDAINDAISEYPGLAEAILEHELGSDRSHRLQKMWSSSLQQMLRSGDQREQDQGDDEKPKDLFDVVEAARKRAGLSVNKQAVNSTIGKFLELLEILETGELDFAAMKKAYEKQAEEALGDIRSKAATAKRSERIYDSRALDFAKDADAMRRELDAVRNELDMLKVNAASLSDARAQEAVNLQYALMKGYTEHKVSPDVAAKCTSYSIYAFLGGTARFDDDDL